MMAFLKRLFDTTVDPVTSSSVQPAPRDEFKESQIRDLVTGIVQTKFATERRSWEVRQELAGNVLRLVSGER